MQNIKTDDLLKLHYFMLLTRMFENRMGKLFQEGRIDENLHRSLGQEAIGVGVTCALKKEDVILPSLRTRAAYLVRGVGLKTMVIFFQEDLIPLFLAQQIGRQSEQYSI